MDIQMSCTTITVDVSDRRSVLYIRICTYTVPSQLPLWCNAQVIERMHVCVYLRKVRENERILRASYVSHQNARELRTTVIRYCDKSSNQVSFSFLFFERVYEAPTIKEKQSIC